MFEGYIRITLSVCPSACPSASPSVHSSFCRFVYVCNVEGPYLSYWGTLKIITSHTVYLSPKKYIMTLTQYHLGMVKVTGRKNTKSVSGLYLYNKEILDVCTLLKDCLSWSWPRLSRTSSRSLLKNAWYITCNGKWLKDKIWSRDSLWPVNMFWLKALVICASYDHYEYFFFY